MEEGVPAPLAIGIEGAVAFDIAEGEQIDTDPEADGVEGAQRLVACQEGKTAECAASQENDRLEPFAAIEELMIVFILLQEG